MSQVPDSFQQSFTSLQGVEPLTLLKVQVTTNEGIVTWRLCLQKSLTWQGQTWALTPFSLTGEGDRAGGEQSRPSLVLPNPEGLFSYYVTAGFFERASITKYEVHPDDVDSGQALISQWYVSKLSELNNKAVSFELHTLSDGNNFKLPARRFTQPEFGLVRL